jgi:hypothetical protein
VQHAVQVEQAATALRAAIEATGGVVDHICYLADMDRDEGDEVGEESPP